MQRQPRGSNNIPSFFNKPHLLHVLFVKVVPGTIFTSWSKHHFVVIGQAEQQVRKPSHCGPKQQWRSHDVLIFVSACSRHIGVVHHTHPVRGESHIQHNANQSRRQWCPAPYLKSVPPHFTFGPPVAAYIQYCISKIWPHLLFFGHPCCKILATGLMLSERLQHLQKGWDRLFEMTECERDK